MRTGRRVLLPVAFLLLACGDRATQACAPAAWQAVVRAHATRYPRMEPDDLYKLLHQGALGSEHAVPSVEAARTWLDRELATLGEGPEEPPVDTIAPGGAHVRVHLRPFVRAGGDPDALLAAFVETANGAERGELVLACALEAAVSMAEAGELPWNGDVLAERWAELEALGYPALHHSDAYAEHYRPAYRVVADRLVPGLDPGLSR